ncbi:MAG: hypothetical protein IJO52_02280, partial [Clostridia bacterium]|nr:hypothetical protein [Clostridia bacterium]
MKRFLITVFLLAMLILTLAVVASAAPQFYLADNKTAVRFENGSSNITVDRAGGAFTILPSTRDPMITIGLSEEEQFDAEEYPIVAFKMSAKTVANVGGFFFGTSKFPGPQGDEYSQFNLLDKEGNMCDYIVDMTSFSHGRWTGTVNKFRIDPINSEDLNATIVLDRLGFFKTKEEAEAFLKSEAVIDTSPAPTPTATPVTWDFENNAELIDEWSPVGGYSSAEFGFLKVTSTSTDVSISTTLSDDEKIDTSKLKYFAYRYWAKDVKNSAGLFFTNQYITSMSDKTYTNFNITGDKRWRNTIYDMSSAGHGNWKGTVDKVRLDVSNPSLTNSVVYISKIGFFSTFEEASAFLADSKDTFDYST